MKIQHMVRTAGLALCLLLLTGCGARRVDPRTLAPDDLYTRATQAYDRRDFGEAIPFLQAFVEQHLGDPRAPDAMMRLGRAHMARREYISAASYFQRLAEDFPASPLNLEARFAVCDSYVRLSPAPQLDQEYTRAALDHCGSVATGFAGTPEAETARTHVAQLREKLAEKVFQNGLFYQRRRAYDSAVIYFGDVVEEYPETAAAPNALRRLLDVYIVLGYVEEAGQTRERLLRDYPDAPSAQGLPAVDSASAAR